jgi:hypothetical protein
MNCFEARSDFIAFWQNTLADEHRAGLLAHLRRCTTCEHSFRIFALTAPILYSATAPPWNVEPSRPIVWYPGGFELSRVASTVERRAIAGTLKIAMPVFAMAAAAAIALYFSVPPQTTFEDAIAADKSNVELASYPSADSLLGQELMVQSSTGPDPSDD